MIKLFTLTLAIAVIHVANAAPVVPNCSLTGKKKLSCLQQGSCSEEELICVPKLYCEGFSACVNSEFKAKQLFLTGVLNGAGSTIADGTNADALYVYGCYAFNTTPNLKHKVLQLAKKNYFYGFAALDGGFTSAVTKGLPNVSVDVRGNSLVGRLRVYCSTGSTCAFTCVGEHVCEHIVFIVEAGASFSLECEGETACSESKVYMEGDSITLSGSSKQNVEFSWEIPEELRDPAYEDQEGGEVEPIVKPDPIILELQKSTRNIQYVCVGPNACSNTGIVADEVITCGGKKSCAKSKIDALRIGCAGESSCDLSTVKTTGTAMLMGYRSGFRVDVTSPRTLFLGYLSGNRAVARSDSGGNCHFAAVGYKAFNRGIFMCADNDECEITCTGTETCVGAVLDCTDTCEDCCTLVGSGIVDAVYLAPCARFKEEGTCEASGYCAFVDDTCTSIRAMCAAQESNSMCTLGARSTHCKWKRNRCVLKSPMPAYKGFPV